MIRKIPLGKQVRATIYIHKFYEWQVIPDDILEQAKDIGLINYFNYDVVKWNKHTNVVSFIYCPGFNDYFEPEVLAVVTVDLKKGNSRERDYGSGTLPAKNPPIYHHTWLMVPDDHCGFIVSRRKIRSADIEETIKKYDIDKRLIGYRKYWEEEFLPLLAKYRLEYSGSRG